MFLVFYVIRTKRLTNRFFLPIGLWWLCFAEFTQLRCGCLLCNVHVDGGLTHAKLTFWCTQQDRSIEQKTVSRNISGLISQHVSTHVSALVHRHRIRYCHITHVPKPTLYSPLQSSKFTETFLIVECIERYLDHAFLQKNYIHRHTTNDA